MKIHDLIIWREDKLDAKIFNRDFLEMRVLRDGPLCDATDDTYIHHTYIHHTPPHDQSDPYMPYC